jgi:hypothetical protein
VWATEKRTSNVFWLCADPREASSKGALTESFPWLSGAPSSLLLHITPLSWRCFYLSKITQKARGWARRGSQVCWLARDLNGLPRETETCLGTTWRLEILRDGSLTWGPHISLHKPSQCGWKGNPRRTHGIPQPPGRGTLQSQYTQRISLVSHVPENLDTGLILSDQQEALCQSQYRTQLAKELQGQKRH